MKAGTFVSVGLDLGAYKVLFPFLSFMLVSFLVDFPSSLFVKAKRATNSSRLT